MKKPLLLVGLGLLSMLNAQTIELTAQQEQDWQIITQTPKVSTTLPLGEFMAEVTTPPQHFSTITLPFEAQVKKLYVASFDSVKKGQLLAEVTGKDWIGIQQKFIEDSIELKHHGHIAERKNRLCKEEIIPKKECLDANAEYQADKIKVAASKALLRGYGASEQMVNNLATNLKISPTIPLRSNVNGKVLELNVQAGKTTMPSDALFTLLKEGALWLESDMLAQKAKHLIAGQNVQITFDGETFQGRVLLHSPTIDPENQTQKVRFSLPNSEKLLSGMRNPATITQTQQRLKVAKTSVINLDGKQSVFLKTAKGYDALEVTIVAEEGSNYYLQDMPKLHSPIATSSLLILKSLMEGEDE